jgi:hypothetical protein
MTLNIAAIDATIARIRANQNFKFNMRDWGVSGAMNLDDDGHFCGTSACIAGFAVIADGKYKIRKVQQVLHDEVIEVDAIDSQGFTLDISKEGKNILGLDQDTADRLFIPDRASVYDEKNNILLDGPNFFSATADQAIAVLEHLRDTGELDWSVSGIEPEDKEFFAVWKDRYGYDYTEKAEQTQ